MSKKNQILTSIILKLSLIIFVIVGVILNILYGFVGGMKTLLYFTTQSNLWICIVDIILVGLLINSYKQKGEPLKRGWIILEQVFTVEISLTGVVYCFILAPAAAIGAGGLHGFSLYMIPAIILHMIVPIIAVVDYFIFTKGYSFKKLDGLFSIIPPIYYFFFALIGYFLNWDFKDGNNYPYFFMNYNNPAGVFGFSNEMPYFMGTFYWDIIIALIVIGFSYLFIFISNKLANKVKDK